MTEQPRTEAAIPALDPAALDSAALEQKGPDQ